MQSCIRVNVLSGTPRYQLAAEQAGSVTAIHVTDGDTVDGGQVLVEIE